MVVVATLMAGAVARSADRACRETCYRAKSMEYQRCRTIPPSDRARRLKCFQAADQALQRCLRAC